MGGPDMKILNKIALLAALMCGIMACNNNDVTTSSDSTSYSSIPDAVFTETEIAADDYAYHQWTNVPPYTFLSSQGYQLVAEFKSTVKIERVSNTVPDSDGYYHCYLAFPYGGDERPTLPNKGILHINKDNEKDIILVETIGTYTNMHHYYYSEKAHAVKEVVAAFKPVEMSEENATKMVGKTILNTFLSTYGELIVMNPYTPPQKNIEVIEPFERIAYYQADKDVEVTFDHDMYK